MIFSKNIDQLPEKLLETPEKMPFVLGKSELYLLPPVDCQRKQPDSHLFSDGIDTHHP